jgi:two-component system chemotaxis sensor kinase CheA
MSDDPLRYFRAEARELTAAMTSDMVRLEAAPSADLVQRLLRHAHTLKGAARVVRQNDIAERVHALEAALLPLRDGPAAPAALADLLRQLDEIAARVTGLDRDTEAASGDDALAFAAADSAQLEALTETVMEAMRQVRSARGAVPASGAPALDRAERDLAQALDAAASLRLAAAASIVTALERTVRDVAQSLGKEAAFVATGGALRLEPRVLAVLRPALIQLVRNAVAHGIEVPAERTGRGKPARGTVTLTIARRGDRVAFVCGDDGAGIDLEAVRRVALQRGVAPAAVAGLGADGLLRLLLEGGLTTAAEPSQLAGHGIGLDIVRDATTRLGGGIEIDTVTGTGTRIGMIVPVALAGIEALLVQPGAATVVALPMAAVRCTARLDRDAADTLLHDGAAIPLRRLDALLSGAPAGAPPRFAAVNAGSDSSTAAIAVERLLGVKTLSVRPLPESATADAFVMGAALDSEGVPILVLDAERLIAAARTAAVVAEAPAAPAKPPILVVDDSLTTRMLEQSILESAGFEVDLAVSAEDAVVKAARRRYGLFLVDVEMPGMDGFTFVAKTRTEADYRDTPALLVSSRNGAEDRRRAAAAGASGYIVKGEFDQSRFLDTVRRLAV